jgi:hypothetical protein
MAGVETPIKVFHITYWRCAECRLKRRTFRYEESCSSTGSYAQNPRRESSFEFFGDKELRNQPVLMWYSAITELSAHYEKKERRGFRRRRLADDA